MDCPPPAEGEGSAHSVLGETGRPDRTDAVRFHLGRHTHLDKGAMVPRDAGRGGGARVSAGSHGKVWSGAVVMAALQCECTVVCTWDG